MGLQSMAGIWYRSAGANPFFEGLIMGEWLALWAPQWLAKDVSRETIGIGIIHIYAVASAW